MPMLRELIDLPVTTSKVTWEAKQVLRDLGEEPKPHILLRIRLAGIHFDERALEPYVRVGKTRSLFVTISRDALAASAYFDEPVSAGGVIEFGYGNEALFRVRDLFEPESVKV